MIKSILSIALLFWILDVSGQNFTGNLPVQYERGYVYLKNGSVLKGKYLYSSSMDKLRLISGKNSWIFDMSEIDKVSKLRPAVPGESPESVNGELPDFNWFNITEIGVLAGNSNNSQNAPMVLSTSLNRQLLHNLSAGLGAGIEFYKETYLPLTANVMYKFRNTRMTPNIALQAGYQIPVEDSRTIYYDVVPDYIISSDAFWPGNQTNMKAKGGLLVNPSVGLMIQSWHGVGLSFSMGYRFHRLHYKAKDDYRLDIDYNRLSLKLGIIIN